MENKYNIKTANCCLNCKFREGRIDTNIICGAYIHNKGYRNVLWVSERMICDRYERTDSKPLTNAENKLISTVEERLQEFRD